MSVRGLRRGSIAASRVTAAPTTYTLYPTIDGYIYSFSGIYATARSGANLSADAVDDLLVGQYFYTDNNYYLREGFLSFDTSSVVGTITSATLSLYHNGGNLATSMTLEARLHPWGPTLTTADWVAGASLSGKTLLASFAVTAANWAPAAYSALVSEAAFLSSINQAGTTDILLCSDRQTAGTTPTGGEYLTAYAVESGGGVRPKLVVVAA